MESQKDVFDRALEFLGNSWLKRNGFQGYVPKSVHTEDSKTPLKETEQ